MRVVHYCQSFSLLSETAIYTWVTELERQGVDCQVLTHRRHNEETRPFGSVHVVPRPRNTDLDRLRWWVMERLGHKSAATSWYTTMHKRLERALHRLRPNVLHAHFGSDAWLVAPAARAVGIPMVVTFHGYDISELVKQEVWRRRYREELWPAVQYATVLSEEMREAVEREGCPPSKVRIVRVGRPVEDMPVREEPEGPFTVVSIGRLAEKKGHDDAIEAIGRLVAEGADLRLRIFGDGELRAPLERLIEERELQSFVHLEGARPNEEVIEALRTAHAFMLCSKTASSGDREGTPNVLVEAQALALPCVSTLHAGIPEMIPNESHWLLANEGDVEGFASRLATLMEMTPEQREAIGRIGRDKMRREYDLATECAKFKAIYSATLKALSTPAEAVATPPASVS
jgi:colanic acid/amylovoran biosynthesis glycosyltransferase